MLVPLGLIKTDRSNHSAIQNERPSFNYLRNSTHLKFFVWSCCDLALILHGLLPDILLQLNTTADTTTGRDPSAYKYVEDNNVPIRSYLNAQFVIWIKTNSNNNIFILIAP